MENRDKLKLKQTELNMEQDPSKRKIIHKEITKLQLRVKIDELKKKLDGLNNSHPSLSV
jgi:hypothetical protein